VVLYWRAIVPGWNDQPATMAHVLDTGRDADAFVFTGYYHKPENATYLREQGVPLPYGEEDYHRRKAMPADLDAAVIAAWRASRISTPLFRKTSCGVAYAHGTPDYNGHWGVREICDICPATQQRRCADDHRQPTPADVDRVLAMFGDHPELVVHDAPAHRGTPRLPALASGGFEHRHRQLSADGIDQEPLHAMDHLPFETHRFIQRRAYG